MPEDLFGVCPYTTAQRLLTGKWTLLLLYRLSRRTLRFGELQRELPHLTQATLSRQLRTMETNRLIVRRVYSQIPPKVEYSLSELGEHFRPVLDTLRDWGDEYIASMRREEAVSSPRGNPEPD